MENVGFGLGGPKREGKAERASYSHLGLRRRLSCFLSVTMALSFGLEAQESLVEGGAGFLLEESVPAEAGFYAKPGAAEGGAAESLPEKENPPSLSEKGLPEPGSVLRTPVLQPEPAPVQGTALPLPPLRDPVRRGLPSRNLREGRAENSGAQDATRGQTLPEAEARGRNSMLFDLPLPRVLPAPERIKTASSVQVQAGSMTAAPVAQEKQATAASVPVAAVRSPAASGSQQGAAPAVAGPRPSTAPARTQFQAVRTPVPVPGISAPAPAAKAVSTPAATPAPPKAADPVKATTDPSLAVALGLKNAANSALLIDGDRSALPDYSLVPAPVFEDPAAPARSLPDLVREARGEKGRTVEIKLPGRGWLYLGTGKTPAGVSFVEKLALADAEQFKFRLDETGILPLQFQRQDVQTGLAQKHLVNLTVAAAGAPVNPEPFKQAADSAILPAASYKPQYAVPLDPGKTPIDTASLVPKQLLQAAAFQDPASQLRGAPSPDESPKDAAGFLRLAKNLESQNRPRDAFAVYEKINGEFPLFEQSDEVFFRLAKLLEDLPEKRDVKRSFDLYVKVQRDYPYSAFVEEAKERARYLQRTFLRQ